MSPLTRLENQLAGWVRWYKFRQSIVWAWRGLIAGLATSLVISLFAVFQGRLLEDEFLLLVIGIALLGMLAAILGVVIWPFSKLEAARYFDRKFGLHERTSTAIELAAAEREQRVEGERRKIAWGTLLVEQQLDDALRSARAVNPRALLPVQIPWREILAALLLVLVTALVWQRGEAFFQIAQQFRVIEQAIDAEAGQIEALIEEIENNPDLTTQQKETLTQPLEEALEGLSEAEILEQAVSTLNSAEQELQAISDKQIQQQKKDLQETGQQLSRDSGGPLDDFAQNLAEGDTIAAANDLENLDVEGMPQSEREELAEQLEQAAEAVAGSNPELAGQLREAAQALRNGDTKAAQETLGEAAQTLRNAGQQIAESEAAQQAATQVGEGEQRLVEVGRPQEQAAGQNQGQDGRSDQNGQDDQGQQGEGPGSSGAGEGQSDGGNSQGGEAGNDPIDQNNAPDGTGERAYEPIYAPERIGGDGEQVAIPGSGEPGNTVIGEGDTAPGDPSPSTVPYQDVFPAYEQAASEAIESGEVPPGYRNLVRDYFSSLEP
ncbi:MAG: hypothetical protein ACE5GO_03205 [Anaerolineales bacterium]